MAREFVVEHKRRTKLTLSAARADAEAAFRRVALGHRAEGRGVSQANAAALPAKAPPKAAASVPGPLSVALEAKRVKATAICRGVDVSDPLPPPGSPQPRRVRIVLMAARSDGEVVRVGVELSAKAYRSMLDRIARTGGDCHVVFEGCLAADLRTLDRVVYKIAPAKKPADQPPEAA